MKDSIFNTMKALNGFVSPSAHEREELEYVKKEIAPLSAKTISVLTKWATLLPFSAKARAKKLCFPPIPTRSASLRIL